MKCESTKRVYNVAQPNHNCNWTRTATLVVTSPSSLTHIQRPWSFLQDLLAMKFVNDDDDDEIVSFQICMLVIYLGKTTLFLQCFDTVGWVIWPVKTRPDMTYNVFVGTLSLTQSINQSTTELVHCTITGTHHRHSARTLQHMTVPNQNIYPGMLRAELLDHFSDLEVLVM